MTVGEIARTVSAIRFQIAAYDAAETQSLPIGWAMQYVPSGQSAQALTFNQATTGTLAASNQYILGSGVFLTDNAPNMFYSRGHKLNDGDQIIISF